MHNFTKRLDTIIDPTGNTSLSNTTYYSKDGNNGNAGSDPNSPKLIYNNDIPTAFAVLGGDQIYPSTSQFLNLIGDGLAIIDGNESQTINTTARIGYENIHMRRMASYKARAAATFNELNNCIFEGNLTFEVNTGASVNGQFPTIQKCLFKNQNSTLAGSGNSSNMRIIKSTFYSSNSSHSVTFWLPTTGGENDIEDCAFVNMKIISNQGQIERLYNSYFDNCTFEIDGVSYPDISSLLVAFPNAIPGYLENGANYKGSLDNNEYFVVNSNSSLIGSGRFGGNIGGTNIGLVFNESNVLSSNNITFNSGNIELTNLSIAGQVVWEDSFGRVVSNPLLRLNGVPDYVNNIIKTIQSVDPQNPSKMTVQLETRDKDELNYRPIRTFSFGYDIGEDSTGKTTGENEFHNLGLENLRVFDVRLTLNVQP